MKVWAIMGKLSGYVRLMRPINCSMIGFAVIVGAALVNTHSLSISGRNLFFGFITGFTLAGTAMAINDYYDREIDAVNEPNRPIPSGLVKPKEALALTSVLTVIGFITAYLTNDSCFVLAIIAWIVLMVYTTVGKRSGLPGNFLVSTCIAIPFIYGSIAVVNSVELGVLIFASMAFLSNTGREVTKGIADVKGDEMQGVKTLAVRYGEKNAAIAAAIFYFSAVLLSPIVWFLELVSLWFIPLVAITDLGLAASSFMLLKDYSREKARKTKNLILLWFIIGLLAFVAGTVK